MTQPIIAKSWQPITDDLPDLSKIPQQLGAKRDPVDQWYRERFVAAMDEALQRLRANPNGESEAAE